MRATLHRLIRDSGSDRGQSLAELALIVPLVAVTLVVVVNTLYFCYGATVFDRAVEQWARANVANPNEPLPKSALPIRFVLGSLPTNRFRAVCSVGAKFPGPFDTRPCYFTLYYTPFGGDVLTAFGLRKPVQFVRKKTVVIPHYLRLVVM